MLATMSYQWDIGNIASKIPFIVIVIFTLLVQMFSSYKFANGIAT